MILENKEKRIRVRTNPDEIAKYRTIKKTLDMYHAEVDKAHTIMKAAFEAEGIPMSGTLDTPDFWKPKSPALKATIARYDKAVAVFKKIVLSLGGAKVQSRLHHLEEAGAFD